MKLKYLLAVSAFCIFYKVYSQSYWTQYTISNSGLPNNNIKSIAIDDNNSIWMLTTSPQGYTSTLTKFDGTTWTNYTTSQVWLTCVAIDSNGKKWVGADVILYGFDGSWTSYNNDNIRTIAIKGNTKWIGSNQGWLAKFDGTTYTTYTISSNYYSGYSPQVTSVAIDTNGVVWVARSNDIGLKVFDGITWTSHVVSNSGLPSNAIYSIAVDTNNVKWISTGSGLTKFDGSAWTNYYGIGGGIITLHHNEKWIGSNGNICLFNDGSFRQFPINNSGGYSIKGIAVDNNGLKWVATSNGLFSFSKNVFSDFMINNSSTTNVNPGSINLTNRSTGAHNYEWQVNGSLFSISTSPSITLISAGTHTITLIADNGSEKDTLSKIILVAAPDAIFNTSSTNVNPDEVVSFTNTSTAAFDYVWKENGVIFSTEINPFRTFDTSGNHIITLIAANGLAKDSASVSIFVNNPVANFSADTTTILPGTTVNFSNASTVSNTYEWKLNNLLFSNTLNTSVTFTTTGTYSVRLVAINGINKDSTSQIITVTKPNGDSICMVSIDTVSDKNLIVWEKLNKTNVKSYNIYKETTSSGVYALAGNAPVNSMSTFIDTSSNPAQNAARYKISVVDSFGNESDQSTFHKTIHLMINAGQNNTWNLLWSAYDGFNFSTYDIYRGNSVSNMQLIASIQNNLFAFSDLYAPVGNLYYAVTVANPNSCSPTAKTNDFESSWSNVVNNLYTGVIENESKNDLFIVPNPSDGSFAIRIQKPDSHNLQIIIYDVLGNELFKSFFTDNNEKLYFDLSGETKGLYFIKLYDGNLLVSISKLILQ
jgi:PKD repeat protein